MCAARKKKQLASCCPSSAFLSPSSFRNSSRPHLRPVRTLNRFSSPLPTPSSRAFSYGLNARHLAALFALQLLKHAE